MNSLFQKVSQGGETLNGRLSHMQCLTGNMLKLIALAAMFFDHFCKIVLQWFIDNYWWELEQTGQLSQERFYEIYDFIRFRLYHVGTIAFPLFCFLLVEGFLHTRSRKRYMGLMGLFALISELPFDIGFFRELAERDGTFPFYWKYQNVFFTLFLGLLALSCMEHFSSQSGKQASRRKALLLQTGSAAVIALAADLIRCDYGAMGILFIAAFYVCRKNRIYQVLLFFVTHILVTNEQPSLYLFLACLIILLYNGQRGKRKWKYIPYVFYPAHITVLYLVTLVLERVIMV